MAPQVIDGKDAATVDPTYMRTQADYHFAMAEAISLDGESEKAIEEFKLAMVYDPKSASIRLRLAAEYLKQGLVSESVEQAEQGVELDGQNTDLRIFLGGVYSSLRMYPQAEKQYMAILEYEPKNPEVFVFMGALYAEQDDEDTAVKYFKKAAKIPDNERAFLAHYYLAKLYLSGEQKKYNKAKKELNKALSIRPEFEEAVLTLADIYDMQNQPEKGLELLESFQTQFGPKKSIAHHLSQIYLEKENYKKAFKHLGVLEGFEPRNLTVKVKMALILIEEKKYLDAVDRLEKILGLAPASDKIRYYLAAVHEELNDTKQAIYNYQKIEASSSFFPDASVRAANLTKKQGNLKEALEIMQSAITLRDDSPTLYAYYASLLDESRSYKTGVKILAGAVDKFPQNTQLRFYLGTLYDRMGDRGKSIYQMKKVVEIDSNHVQGLNYLAYTYADASENLDEAEQLALRALDLQPNDGYILDTVGWVYFKRGEVEEAIRYLEAAYSQKPNEAIVAEHLGDAYYVYELVGKAKEMYQRAVKLETDQTKISKIKAKLVTLERALKTDDNRKPASVSDSGADSN